MTNRLTTHHQKIKLVHIPPTTRQRWVKNDKEFQDPEVGRLKPDLSSSGELCLEALEYVRSLDPDFVDVRFNGSSHPNNPLDAAAQLGITLEEFKEREKKLERKVCEFLDVPISTAKRCACPPESVVAQEEGGAHAA